MAIRDWSFTTFWAVTTGIWLLSALGGEIANYFDSFELIVLGIAYVPAFLAGAWAGTHPEIERWPRSRVIAMWALATGAFVGATDFLNHWRLAASVLAAPIAILTIRWYELTGGTPGHAVLPKAAPATDTLPPPPATTGSDHMAG